MLIIGDYYIALTSFSLVLYITTLFGYYSSRRLSSYLGGDESKKGWNMYQLISIFFFFLGLFLVLVGVILGFSLYRNLSRGQKNPSEYDLETNGQLCGTVFTIGLILTLGNTIVHVFWSLLKDPPQVSRLNLLNEARCFHASRFLTFLPSSWFFWKN